MSLLFVLPVLRLARALPSTSSDSPHQQAYNYLKSGKTDVYFGWYPISHFLYDRSNIPCIEAPIWVGMNQPERIKFDLSLIPSEAIFLATSPTGYGKAMLPQFIGQLKDCPSPKL